MNRLRLLFRSASIACASLTTLCLAAPSAHAMRFFFSPPAPDTLSVGDTFDITFRIDTESETRITSIFISVYADPDVVQFVSGYSPGSILIDPDTWIGIPLIGQPKVLVSDVPGLVRATNFSAANAPGVASPDQLLATMTFMAVGPGATQLLSGGSLVVPGALANDGVYLDGVKDLGPIGFDSSATITVVPEPGTALLLGVGLAKLSRRSRHRSENKPSRARPA